MIPFDSNLDIGVKSRYERSRDALFKSFNSMNNISDLCFSNVFLWSRAIKTHYIMIDEYFCCSLDLNGKTYYYAPFGEIGHGDSGVYENVINTLYSLYAQEGELSLAMIPEILLPTLQGLKRFSAEISYDPAHSDYIYDNSVFTDITGGASARYDYNHFIKHHNPSFLPINSNNISECLNVIDKYWCSGKSCSDCYYGCERFALEAAVLHFSELEMLGALVFCGGEPWAFTLAKFLNPSAIGYQFQKIKRGVRGLQTYLLYNFSNYAHPNAEYINFTEDMGLEGLRAYKSGLGAFTQVHKYEAVLRKK